MNPVRNHVVMDHQLKRINYGNVGGLIKTEAPFSEMDNMIECSAIEDNISYF